MFNVFILTFVIYVVSLLAFPLYRFFITSKYYIVSNALLLLTLLISATNLVHDLFTLEGKFYITTAVNNYWANIIDFSFSIALTPLSLAFGYLVILIGFSTNIYTLNYFKGEADETSFVFWLNAFIASMLTLVLSHNFYSIFLGWELIGLTSFFLINFWQAKRSTLKSSLKAFSFNLVSDIFLLIALVCFYRVSNTTDCATFIYLAIWENLVESAQLQIGLISLVLCASIKSVQIGGHLWLPDSMEAPVPASSLIHSATLVSAGIFILSKFNTLFLVMGWSPTLALIGSITAAYGGVVSAAQTDLKKLLAYSTMSHCGFLWVLACSGDFYITIFYLFLHGLFKASSFYCAGSFIRNYGSQDSRLMGNSHTFMRLDTVLFLICSANLAGLPFTIGYYFKSFFFKFMVLKIFSSFTIGFLLVGLLSSLIYFFRLTFYVTFDLYKSQKYITMLSLSNIKKSFTQLLSVVSINHLIAVFILIIFSIFFVTYYHYYYVSTPIMFNDTQLTGWLLFLLKGSILYKSYYLYFYSLYLAIFLLLVFVGYRKSIFALENIFVFFYIITIILLLL